MTAKTIVRKTIRHNTGAPPAIQAAQIALVLMQVAKASSWEELLSDETLAQRVELTKAQQALLEAHRGILPYLTRGGYDGTLRSVIACPKCNRLTFTAAGTAPTKCQMTLGCDGAPVKAKSMQEPLPKSAEPVKIAA